MCRLSAAALLLGFGATANTEAEQGEVASKDKSKNGTSHSTATHGPQYRVLTDGTRSGRTTTALPESTTPGRPLSHIRHTFERNQMYFVLVV